MDVFTQYVLKIRQGSENDLAEFLQEFFALKQCGGFDQHTSA
jgi:hypothetical protein